MTAKRKRHVWKTFYFTDHTPDDLLSMWQNTPHARHHVMDSDSPGFVETNVPLSILRSMFRILDVEMPDYVSDTKPSWEEERT